MQTEKIEEEKEEGICRECGSELPIIGYLGNEEIYGECTQCN